MYGERVLLGWQAIEMYMDETWHIPPTTLQEYRPGLAGGRFVLRRVFGQHRRAVRVFSLPSILDEWVRTTFSIPHVDSKYQTRRNRVPKHQSPEVRGVASEYRRER